MMARLLSFLAASIAAVLLSLAVPVGPLAPNMAAAQSTPAAAPDYAAWEQVAFRAEGAVEAARASDAALANLRTEIAGWRAQFQALLSANDSRLNTIRDQLAALGPLPEAGTEEAPEIAQRRSELNEQLTRLSTPRRSAEEAFSRANGIISEIDVIVRARQANALLKRGPVPLNPAMWPRAVDDLSEAFRATWAGMVQAWRTDTSRDQAQDNLPLVLVLVAAAVVLLSRSRIWAERMATRVAQRGAAKSAGLAGFVVSFGQILFPLLGLIALIWAVDVSGLYGPRGEVILATLPLMGVGIFFARWIGSRIFPTSDAVNTPLRLPEERRTEGRFYASLLGVVFAVDLLISRLGTFDRFGADTVSGLAFPLIVIAALIIFRLGQLLRRSHTDQAEQSDENAYRIRVIGLLGQAACAVGLIAPLLAAAGYNTAANQVIFPAGLSLALFASIALLQEAVRDGYVILTKEEQSSEGLIPTLLSFVLLVASLPVFALIWGARVTDLTELWTRARAGITLGETTISPGSLLTLIVVFMIGYSLTRATQGTLKTSVLPKTKIDPGGQVAMVSGVGYVGIFLAALVAITSAGIDLSSLAIVAGALSVGIGFGLQNIVSNFVSGIILLIERPISEGDWIEVGGQHGYVRDISVRSTRIETFDRTDVIVPNADLVSGTVTNYTRGNTVGRLIVPVGVAYGTDTDRVDAILSEISQAHPMIVSNPAPSVVFMAFGADSLDFEIRAILRDVNWSLSVRNDLNHAIAKRFVAEGIEIPFGQRDIWLRNPEALATVAPRTSDTDNNT